MFDFFKQADTTNLNNQIQQLKLITFKINHVLYFGTEPFGSKYNKY